MVHTEVLERIQKGGRKGMLLIIEDSLMDSVKLIPFLFLTYVAMEYLEHSAGKRMEGWLKQG